MNGTTARRAAVIDGRALADKLLASIREQARRMAADGGPTPGLAVVLVGSDPASGVYVRNKRRTAQACGFHSVADELPADTGEAELLALIRRLNDDPAIHGILVQLPLPKHIDSARVIEAVDPAKDVDGFHPLNAGLLAGGALDRTLLPCTPAGCLRLIRSAVGADLAGRRAVVLGRSRIVGRPMAQLLLQADCTVTIAHSRTRDLPELCRQGEILVVAVGQPQLVRKEWVKPGAIVIDVGIHRADEGSGNGRLVGDVDSEGAREVAAALTPVPGGVGPMTIAMLMLNTLRAACRRHGMEEPAI